MNNAGKQNVLYESQTCEFSQICVRVGEKYCKSLTGTAKATMPTNHQVHEQQNHTKTASKNIINFITFTNSIITTMVVIIVVVIVIVIVIIVIVVIITNIIIA